MGSRVNDMPCTGPNRAVQTEHYETPPTQEPQQVQTEPTRMADEKDKNLALFNNSRITEESDDLVCAVVIVNSLPYARRANATYGLSS